ncbi:hypothetical protein IM697_27075 [Streptomyces ferrugineus]|uniref:Restriction endonuclease n=1 Tax=Streptomyces ferrugineus TaxID=1413221 RepID=A0A7M2SY28_9ACTN|nr:hypothetical protein IM697_27075 [Streptomyces ferrugineus]
MPVDEQHPPPPASRRSRRKQAVSELRAQGRYGPGLRDVLPAFAGLGLAVLVPVFLLVWLHRGFGVAGLAIGVGVLAAIALVALRLRRGVVRRRGGRYTAQELALLDERGLAEAVGRILRRDGWRVVDLTLTKGRRRLHARDRQGRRLDVRFRAEETAEAEDSPATLVEPGEPDADSTVQVIVHPGSFSRAETRWASLQEDVRLVDGGRLQRWARGVPLDELEITSSPSGRRSSRR